MSVETTTVPKSDKIVCSNCKQEANFKGEDLLDIDILDDIMCIHCNGVLISCRPELKPAYVYVPGQSYNVYD